MMYGCHRRYDYYNDFVVLLVSCWYCSSSSCLALDNGLGLTPPMGWNSWNHFHCNINEELIHTMADAMVTTGLRDVGYEYINLDDCWQQSRDNLTQKIIEDKDAFPSGMKALGEYIHRRGLKYGLYSDSGHQTCQKRPGSFNFETIDAQSYAEFGCDYLKYDNCNIENNTQAALQERYGAMRDALNATGRPIFFSLCEWGLQSPATWAAPIGNSWRTTRDIGPSWNSILSNLDINNEFAKYAQRGAWNDPDMLEVGNGDGLTFVEQRTHFTLWAIMKSPLLLGNDITKMTQETMEIISNPEMIAINQDPLGIQARRLWQLNITKEQDGDTTTTGLLEAWAGPLSGGAYVVVLFNRSVPRAQQITITWDDIGIDPPNKNMKVRDLWNYQDLTNANGQISAIVDPHDVLAVRLTPIPTNNSGSTGGGGIRASQQ